MECKILRPFIAIFALVSAVSGANNAGVTTAAVNDQEVIIVFKQHYDIGFWGRTKEGPTPGFEFGMTCPATARQIVETFKTSHLDQAFAVFDQTQNEADGNRFVWTMPGWVMAQMLDQPADRRAKVLDRLKSGQLATLANPFSTQTESLDPEGFARGLVFSSRIARELNQPLPIGANMTDVPEHTFALPTLFSHAGIKFFRTGINGGSAMANLPPLYWWEGPDGSRVLCMYGNLNKYSTSPTPPKNWPCKTWLWLNCSGDNVGCEFNAAKVRQAMAGVAKAMPGAKVRVGSIDDFARAVLAENPDLPVIRTDNTDTWIHGIMSMPAEVAIARTVRPRLMALEELDTLLAGWTDGKPSATKIVATAYEKSLLFSEHTWGSLLNYKDPKAWRYGEDFVKAWEDGLYKDVDATYQEHGDYIRSAQALVEPAIAERMNALARAVNIAGDRVVVFNPLPWKRNAVVEVAGEGFVAEDIPACGYKTIPTGSMRKADMRESALKLDEATSSLENPFLKVTLDPSRGTISSIVDKRTGRELVDQQARYGFGQYLYERFSSNEIQSYIKSYSPRPAYAVVMGKRFLPPATQVPYATASPSKFSLATALDSMAATATLTSEPGDGIPHGIALKVTLPRDAAYVELEWSIRDKRPDLWPEAGWLCLPAKIEQPQYRLSRMLGVIDPAKDIAPSANFELFCVENGLTIRGQDNNGLAIFPLDSPLVSLGHPGLMRYSRKWTPREPVAFVNLFNNTWGCNFRQWVDGSWSSRVRVSSVTGSDEATHLLLPSIEARNPCLTATATGPAGTLPAEQSGISVSRKGVLVTAFGADPDGVNQGTLLRVWEQAGNSGELTVTLPANFKTAKPVNLRGENAGKPIAIHSGKLTFNLPACAPASFVLE